MTMTSSALAPIPPSLTLQSVLLTSTSFKVHKRPHTVAGKFDTHIDFHHEATPLDAAQHYAVGLTASVFIRSAGDLVFEAVVALELICETNAEGQDLQGVLTAFAPTQMIPYVRQHLADLSTRAGFPPVLVPPLSFSPVAPIDAPSSTLLQ